MWDKSTFDVRSHSNQAYRAFENTKKGFNQLMKWVRNNNTYKEENTLFALEHTGIYSEQITQVISGGNNDITRMKEKNFYGEYLNDKPSLFQFIV